MGSSDFFEPTRAATLLGASFSAAPAGRLLPLEWTCPARIAAKIMRDRSWLRKDLMVEDFLLVSSSMWVPALILRVRKEASGNSRYGRSSLRRLYSKERAEKARLDRSSSPYCGLTACLGMGIGSNPESDWEI